MVADEKDLAQNQRSFRHANERLGDALSEAGLDGNVVAFLCECSDEYCLGRIELQLDQYAEAHLLPDTYVILTGHSRIEDEEILEDRGLFEVVQKG
jgi:hypothetical protein